MFSKQNDNKIQKVIKKYKLVQKSPYSQSYYTDGKITWDYKPEGSLRLSDHWNFYSEGKIHCKTLCGTTKGWYVGRYENGYYTLIEKVFTKEEEELENRICERVLKKRKELCELRERKERRESERKMKFLTKGGYCKIAYTVYTKVKGRFYSKDYEEVCFCKGCWAYTSNGRKRSFMLMEIGVKQDVEKN